MGVTLVLVDTNTKGISEGEEIIKRIEIPAEIAAKNAMTVAKDDKGQEIKAGQGFSRLSTSSQPT